MTTETRHLHVDILLIGGGVAGLWLLHRLCAAGYHAVLFEPTALGSGQSVASQGMIHGGVKYTLGGALSGASEAIADMPAHWRRCMAGEGDVDLRGTRVLSEHFYLWSPGGAVSRATAFLASKALRGRVDALTRAEYPALFQQPAFRGSLYKLVDLVLDVPSLVAALQRPLADRILGAEGLSARLLPDGDGARLALAGAGQSWEIHSQLTVLTAGKGNGELMQQLGVGSPAMQLRPLQQVMVRHRHHEPLYAHCIGTDSKPRLTISSHRQGDHTVWYLGGQLAEDGAALAAEPLLARAARELAQLFPWLDWREAEWATFPVDRAEPAQPGLLRPDNAWLSACGGLPRCLAAWPTKLTLAPNLGSLLLAHLQQAGIRPQASDPLPPALPRQARIAPAPWETTPFRRLA